MHMWKGSRQSILLLSEKCAYKKISFFVSWFRIKNPVDESIKISLQAHCLCGNSKAIHEYSCSCPIRT